MSTHHSCRIVLSKDKKIKKKEYKAYQKGRNKTLIIYSQQDHV